VDAGLVYRREAAVHLRLVVAMRALVPLHADVVLHGLVPREINRSSSLCGRNEGTASTLR